MSGQNNCVAQSVLVDERISSETLPGNAYPRRGKLVLRDGTTFEGISFGYEGPAAGEVVFGTGMVGYPETLTDASFSGQILVMTYPIIGNYGVPEESYWEDEHMHVSGLVVSNYIDMPSHAQSTMNLGTWLHREMVPALEIKDTRLLTQHIRERGVMPGKIIFDADVPFYDPDGENLVARVSTQRVLEQGTGDITIALIDCGAKRSIAHSLLARNARVVTVPWDYDLFAPEADFAFDGILVSNGPGNPKMAQKTIQTIQTALGRRIPVFGICLGHQLLALAAGGDTYKLKFGHRSQNQPCLLDNSVGTPLVGDRVPYHVRAARVDTHKGHPEGRGPENSMRCYITTQNHGFAVGTLPPDFVPWFVNANDGSNEGMHHIEYPFFSVQFHPEAMPGPVDTEWLFDYFLQKVRG